MPRLIRPLATGAPLSRAILAPRDDHYLRHGLLNAVARGKLSRAELEAKLRDLSQWDTLDPSSQANIRAIAEHEETI